MTHGPALYRMTCVNINVLIGLNSGYVRLQITLTMLVVIVMADSAARGSLLTGKSSHLLAGVFSGMKKRDSGNAVISESCTAE